MFSNEYLQRVAGRVCLMLVFALGMMGYHYANVRFLPLMAGFAILAGLCYMPRATGSVTSSFRESGQHPAI